MIKQLAEQIAYGKRLTHKDLVRIHRYFCKQLGCKEVQVNLGDSVFGTSYVLDSQEINMDPRNFPFDLLQDSRAISIMAHETVHALQCQQRLLIPDASSGMFLWMNKPVLHAPHWELPWERQAIQFESIVLRELGFPERLLSREGYYDIYGEFLDVAA